MKRSVKFRYFFTYLALVLIPIFALGSFVQIYSTDINRAYISSAKLSAFENATAQIDKLVGSMSVIADHFSTLGEETALNEGMAVTVLTYYENLAANPIQIFLYKHGSHAILSSGGKLPYETVERAFENSADLTMSGFFVRLNTIDTAVMYKLEAGSESSGLVAYICPLASYLNSSPYVLAFIMGDGVIREVLEDNMGPDAEQLYIYAPTLEPFYSDFSKPEDGGTLAALHRLKGTGILNAPDGFRRHVIMRVISSGSGLTYLCVSPEHVFYADMPKWQAPVIIMITTLAAMCVGIALLFTRSSYKPIRKLVFDITGDNAPHTRNEFDAIKTAYQNSTQKSDYLSQQIDRQNLIISSHFALRLIGGKWKNEDEFLYYQQYSGFLSALANYAAIVVKTSNLPAGRGVDNLLRASAFIPIENIRIIYTELPLDSGICYIVNFDGEDTTEIIRGISEKLYAYLTEAAGLEIKVGAGGAVGDPHMLNNSFYQAVAVLRSAGEAVGVYRRNGDAGDSFRRFHFEQSLLIEGITYGDEKISISALDEFFLYPGQTRSFLEERVICYNLINVIVKTASNLSIGLDLKEFDSLAAFNTFEQFESECKRLISHVCRLSSEARASRDSVTKNGLIHFINQNYTNPDMNLDAVSTQLGMSKAKINAILKEDFGYSFIQYVSLLRLDETKRLLIETDTSISDIVAGVGYSDVSNYTRKFKSIEGVTMGQYRMLHKAGAADG